MDRNVQKTRVWRTQNLEGLFFPLKCKNFPGSTGNEWGMLTIQLSAPLGQCFLALLWWVGKGPLTCSYERDARTVTSRLEQWCWEPLWSLLFLRHSDQNVPDSGFSVSQVSAWEPHEAVPGQMEMTCPMREQRTSVLCSCWDLGIGWYWY